MPTFRYTAISVAGNRVQGDLAAATEQAVLAELESRRLTPVRVEQAAERPALTRGVSLRKLGQSYTQLGDLLKAGVPMLRALRLLARKKSAPRLATVFEEIAQHVADGGELSVAMSGRPDVIPRVHAAMVRAGEQGGFLEQVFLRLGQLVTRQANLRGKVLGSLIYPIFLVVVGLAILAAVFVFFVPGFEKELASRLTELPLLTEIVLGISHVLNRHGLLLVGAMGGGAGAAWWAWTRPDVRQWVSTRLTYAPGLGTVVRAVAAARFCRMLGTMEANGVPLIQAMQISREAAGNAPMERAIEQATEAVRAGESLAEPLGRSGLFDEDVIEIIAVGEQAGNVAEVLLGIAETLEDRIERLLEKAVRLIEPVTLLLIAGGVGLVAASLIMPMMQLGSAV